MQDWWRNISLKNFAVPGGGGICFRFRYRNPIIREGDVVIAILQSGETADTLAAIDFSQSKGALFLEFAMWWVHPYPGHPRRCLHPRRTRDWRGEHKAFTAQLTVLNMIALIVAQKKGTITEQSS